MKNLSESSYKSNKTIKSTLFMKNTTLLNETIISNNIYNTKISFRYIFKSLLKYRSIFNPIVRYLISKYAHFYFLNTKIKLYKNNTNSKTLYNTSTTNKNIRLKYYKTW